jgi:hypothetical protein
MSWCTYRRNKECARRMARAKREVRDVVCGFFLAGAFKDVHI